MTDLSHMTREQLEAMISQLKAAKASKLALKVSDKGAVSLYGMGRFPVTLYRGQWERLLNAKDELVAFIEANSASLTVKA